MQVVIEDPGLYYLFKNAVFPKKLDTVVKWRGYTEEDQESPIGIGHGALRSLLSVVHIMVPGVLAHSLLSFGKR